MEGNLRTLRPLYKYSFNDGQQIYIAGRNADIVQYTTSESRFWAYLGAIPHWLYFTPLRKHQPEWFQFVVWSSAIGTAAALLGIIVAIWMLSPSKRYRHAGAPTSIPYRGWKRWHTIIGLFFGVVTATWAFSGMLSMGPFDLWNDWRVMPRTKSQRRPRRQHRQRAARRRAIPTIGLCDQASQRRARVVRRLPTQGAGVLHVRRRTAIHRHRLRWPHSNHSLNRREPKAELIAIRS